MSTSDQRQPYGKIIGKARDVPRQIPGAPMPASGSVLNPGAPVAGVRKPDTPAIRLRRLAGVASWALVLVLAGVATAIIALVKIINGVPSWFQPVFMVLGVTGMLLTMFGFATVRFRGMPWLFMAASSITLVAAFVMLATL